MEKWLENLGFKETAIDKSNTDFLPNRRPGRIRTHEEEEIVALHELLTEREQNIAELQLLIRDMKDLLKTDPEITPVMQSVINLVEKYLKNVEERTNEQKEQKEQKKQKGLYSQRPGVSQERDS